MTTSMQHHEASPGPGTDGTVPSASPGGPPAGGAGPTTEQVWGALAKTTCAVLGFATPGGDPRSSGVVYTTVGHRLFVAVAPDSWKARYLAASGRVAVVVPVRRGGLLSLAFPIPPATVSFHGAAIVHPAGSSELRPLLDQLASLLPPERRASSVIVEIVPEGEFLTYGLGVSLRAMRTPATARGRAPVS